MNMVARVRQLFETRQAKGIEIEIEGCEGMKECQIMRYIVAPTHLFLPSVLTVMALPRRDGARNSELELGPLTVSVDFQLSVLELVAELLRTSFSFLVMVDQQSQLGDGHGMG